MSEYKYINFHTKERASLGTTKEEFSTFPLIPDTVFSDFEDKAVAGSLGLDMSLTSTGWSYTNDGVTVHFGDLSQKLTGTERITYIISAVRHFLRVYRPAVIMLEDYAYGQATSAYYLGELGIFVRMLCEKYVATYPEAVFHKVATTDLKKTVSGKGNAGKDLMLMHVLLKYNVVCENNDQADAVGLCMMGFKGYDVKVKVKKPRKKKKED